MLYLLFQCRSTHRDNCMCKRAAPSQRQQSSIKITFRTSFVSVRREKDVAVRKAQTKRGWLPGNRKCGWRKRGGGRWRGIKCVESGCSVCRDASQLRMPHDVMMLPKMKPNKVWLLLLCLWTSPHCTVPFICQRTSHDNEHVGYQYITGDDFMWLILNYITFLVILRWVSFY